MSTDIFIVSFRYWMVVLTSTSSVNCMSRTLSLPSRSGVPPQFAARTVSKSTLTIIY
ncbi:hypothetical protein JW960_04185 [candidate division KSB1 bacterium]|nr:hypothetical protein [candidate division KSB1 bacterium]